MFEKLVTKKVKCVYQDTNNIKVCRGVLTSFNDTLINITEESGLNKFIAISKITEMREEEQ